MVSIPYRKYKKFYYYYTRICLYKFPSLIGSIKRQTCESLAPMALAFPSLIGSIKSTVELRCIEK